MGEVPDAITAPTTTINDVTGVNLVGYPYPADIKWTNTQLAKNGVVNDQLFTWNITNQAYNIFTRTVGGWAGGTNVVIRPGEGFWFRTTRTQTWTEAKPYTWP
jgi:hypothetical protein